MENYHKKIKQYLDEHEYITVKQALEIGVKRYVLAEFAKQGKLERIKRGIYSAPNEWIDEFEILQRKNERVIFSYGTALYFHGVSDRAPNVVHVSVPQGYNIQHIKRQRLNVVAHYVKKKYYDFGTEMIRSPQGGMIKVYDLERCICDIIRDKKNVDMQIYQDAIKRYFNLKDKDVRKLLKYSKIFNIEDKVRNYMEVLI